MASPKIFNSLCHLLHRLKEARHLVERSSATNRPRFLSSGAWWEVQAWKPTWKKPDFIVEALLRPSCSALPGWSLHAYLLLLFEYSRFACVCCRRKSTVTEWNSSGRGFSLQLTCFWAGTAPLSPHLRRHHRHSRTFCNTINKTS